MDKIHKSPFSLYDFLGYFIPGALFWYLFVIVFDIDNVKLSNLDFFKELPAFDQSVAFIIVSYVLGHAINYLSSLSIERYSIWSIGYPSRYIFGDLPESYFKKLKNKEDRKEKISHRISMIWRTILMIAIFPLYITDLVIGKMWGFRRYYTNPLDSTLKMLIKKRIDQFKIKHKYNFDGESNGEEDFFRPIWHYYYENFEAHAVKLDNYVALYGFTRTMSLIFCIYCWLIAISIFFHVSSWSNNVISIALSMGLSYVFYLAFVKFYRRFTLEGFMCLVIDPELNES